MIEGTSNQNDDVVRRLHGIIRPFVLRRLKKDVETQLPGKFEHILKCQLSRRQVRHFLWLFLLIVLIWSESELLKKLAILPL